jgi:hypothetical protein
VAGREGFFTAETLRHRGKKKSFLGALKIVRYLLIFEQLTGLDLGYPNQIVFLRQ